MVFADVAVAYDEECEARRDTCDKRLLGVDLLAATAGGVSKVGGGEDPSSGDASFLEDRLRDAMSSSTSRKTAAAESFAAGDDCAEEVEVRFVFFSDGGAIVMVLRRVRLTMEMSPGVVSCADGAEETLLSLERCCYKNRVSRRQTNTRQ